MTAPAATEEGALEPILRTPQVSELVETIGKQATEIAYLKQAHAEIMASTSWRMTQPLRSLAMWLRGSRPKSEDPGRS